MTEGRESWEWTISDDGRSARTSSNGIGLHAEATDTGAALRLRVRNNTLREWPTLAAIVPCLSPDYQKFGGPTNEVLFDEDHTHTFFYGRDGFELLQDREMHYADGLKDYVRDRSPENDYEFPAFVDKWPYSPRDFTEPLLVRESPTEQLIMAIAWDRSVTAQGHNPRRCLHLSAQVGPLSPGEERVVEGRVYLMRGTKTECLTLYKKDFGVQ